MLTQEQLAVIDGIPVQGSLTCTYKGKELTFTSDIVNESAAFSFDDKAKLEDRDPSKKRAIIMWGAPGVGKTDYAYKLYDETNRSERNSTVFVGYNEGGAEQNFAPFNSAMEGISGYNQRLAVTNSYRPITQLIQNTTLKRALREEFSVVIDITAENPGAGKLIDVLRKLDYQRVDMIGIDAPFDIAQSRATDRARPTDPMDIVTKRTGAYNFMKAHALKSDSFTLLNGAYFMNPVPVLETTLNLDKAVVHDEVELSKIWASMRKDTVPIEKYLRGLAKTREHKDINVSEIMADYTKASSGAIDFMVEAFQRWLRPAAVPAVVPDMKR